MEGILEAVERLTNSTEKAASRRVFAFAADSASEYRSQLHSEISERTNDNCRMNRPSELPQVRWPAVDESKLPMNSHGRVSIRTRNC